MNKYIQLCVRAGLVLIALPTMAANLITNPGNEAALVAGEISGWTEIVGTNWTQRSADPLAAEGTYYFFAGVGTTATLRQVVDVSSFASGIDAGQMAFVFSGSVRSFLQSPPDSTTINLTFLSATNAALGSFSSGAITNTSAWQIVTSNTIAPSLTRSVQIDLNSIRNAGSNNDGYFDALNLEVLPVPEPQTALLLLLGLGAVASITRLRKA